MNRIVINVAVVLACWAGVSIAESSATDETVIYVAEEIITMDPAMPRAHAVAVADGRILGVGSREEMIKLSGGTPALVDERFADKVIVPGLIEQHIHPVLSALTLWRSASSKGGSRSEMQMGSPKPSRCIALATEDPSVPHT